MRSPHLIVHRPGGRTHRDFLDATQLTSLDDLALSAGCRLAVADKHSRLQLDAAHVELAGNNTSHLGLAGYPAAKRTSNA